MPDELSPTARALLALEAIQGAPGITADRLGARLGVSGRAVRRYIGILREAGIPVDSVTGPYGGYRLGRGARVPPLTFSTAEALGLVMAVLQGWHGSVQEEHPAATALAKIVRVLPAAAAAPAEAMRRVRAQNPSDAAAMPDPALTANIAQACETRRTIRVSYQTGHAPWDMIVDPWAVVVRHGRWYLLCWAHHANARRVLRLDRVRQIEPSGGSFDPIPGLDAVREVEDHLAEGWAYDIEVRFDAPFEAVAHWTPRTMGKLLAIDEHSCLLHGSTDFLDGYAAGLAAIPLSFRVVRPDELREELLIIARRISQAADARSGPDGSSRDLPESRMASAR